METDDEQIPFYDCYRKYPIDIDDKTFLLVKFIGMDVETGFLYPRSRKNGRGLISPYEVLHQIEERIRNEFFENQELPVEVFQSLQERDNAVAIFELEGLFERNGYYEAVYSYSHYES